ncbi:MAG: hypothetical protein ACFCUU_18505 [Cyclobacteriaceae bacterium]
MKKSVILIVSMLLCFNMQIAFSQCRIPWEFGSDICPTSNLSARLESNDSQGISLNPIRIITNASQIQPDTEYNLYVFHDSFPNENVIACIGNNPGFTIPPVIPFCPSCRDMGSFAYFQIKTNANYTPGTKLRFSVFVACSADKNCGNLYCGPPYEMEYDLENGPEAELEVP